MNTSTISSFDKIKSLQELNTTLKDIQIPLPQLVVVGPQSCGKSSVLASIIKMDILPCGNNLVTKCPIILNLHQCNTNYTIIANKKYTNPNEIKLNIKAEMLLNSLKEEVSDKPVVLDIYGPTLIDITLVDLPGLIKNPNKNQSENIDEKIENMVLNYIKEENTFILAIINGCVDLANSESLKLSKKVDKDCKRTLGIITKLDLLDKGTDVIDILKNKLYPLKNGYFGIVNRNSEQVSANVHILDVRKLEKDFLKKFANYKTVADRFGYKMLTEKLYSIFVELATEQQPKIIQSINEKLIQLQKEESISFNSFESVSLYYDALVKIIENSSYKNTNFSFSINEPLEIIIQKEFLKEIIFTSVDKELKNELIFTNSLFLSEKILKKFYIKMGLLLKNNILYKIDQIFHCLINYIKKIEGLKYKKYTNFINAFVIEKLTYQYEDLKKNLEKYFEIETSIINFDHPDFIPSKIFVNTLEVQKKESWFFKEQNKVYDREMEYKLLSKFIDTYFEIFKKGFVSFAKKSVWFYFVNFIEQNLFYVLNQKFSSYSDNELKEEKEVIQNQIGVLSSVKDKLEKIFE